MSHGTITMIDRRQLLPATYHFNPAIAAECGSIWMVYRRVSPDEWLAGPRTLGLCRLGRDLQPIAESNVDLSAHINDPPGAHRWHADPRFFRRGKELWLSYHDNYSLFLTPIAPTQLGHTLRPRSVHLIGYSRRERERNWGFFDDGEFKAVYAIPSHIVLGLRDASTCFEASPLYHNKGPLPWDMTRWGEPHGGCMPVKVGSHWFSFFQSATYDPATEHRHYHVGFYGFEAEPPHRIAYMSANPILTADRFPGARSFYKGWAVVYPSASIFHENRWLVSLGIHDRELALAIFHHDALLQDCATL